MARGLRRVAGKGSPQLVLLRKSKQVFATNLYKINVPGKAQTD